MAKHYIRLDEQFIIKTFTTDFEKPLESDVCVNEDGGRHFNLQLLRDDGLPKYRYTDGQITETTDDDLANLLERMALEKEKTDIEKALSDEDWKVARQFSSDSHKMTDVEYAAFGAMRDVMRDRIDEIVEMLVG